MFEKVNSKVVKVNLAAAGGVMARQGSMIYYTGQANFIPHNIATASGGMFQNMLRTAGRMVAGEHEVMMEARGTGEIYYGRAGLTVTIVQVQGQTMTVEMSRMLGHTMSLQSSVVPVTSSGGAGGGGGMMGMLRGAVSGAVTGQGFFTSQLSGNGSVAILSHGGTIDLPVNGNEVMVDPQAYVGHLGNINVQLTAALSWRDAIGRGSGEAMQLKCTGQGVVYVQASEEKL